MYRQTCPKKYRRHGKGGFFLLLILFVLLFIYSFTYFNIKIRPAIVSVANARASNAALRLINSVVDETVTSSGIKYKDLVDFKTNSNGEITAISANISKINLLKADVAKSIQNRMAEIGPLVTKIPIGTLMGYDIFSGIGPRIPIKLVPVGYADIDVKSHFSSSGINQTKHEIELLITAKVDVLLPMKNTSIEVKTQLPIAQTVIVGNVPDNFTNVEGTTGAPEDNVLNLLQ